LNPEQLLVLAAASCQLLSFLAVAARARIDVRRYVDEGTGTMDDPPTRLTSIVLRPTIWVAPGPSDERVAHLVEVAHRECYVANSLRTDLRVEPKIIFEAPVEDVTN
jgi:organic hydroperoxide reductase OsmC/OhrA